MFENKLDKVKLTKKQQFKKPSIYLQISFSYHNGLLDGFLNLHTLAGDGLIQFPLKGQEIHVGLGLWDQVSDLKRITAAGREY